MMYENKLINEAMHINSKVFITKREVPCTLKLYRKMNQIFVLEFFNKY